MNIFDSCIKEVNSLFSSYQIKNLQPTCSWKQGETNAIIFDDERALSFGDNSNEGLSLILFTDNKELINSYNDISLIGEEISEIKENRPLARITLIQTKDLNNLNTDELFKCLSKIDYTKYHISPIDAMMTISVINKKESLIISKQAIKDGISFAKLGKLFNDQYLKNENVISCKTVFVNDINFDFKTLINIRDKCSSILKALDHLNNKINMDCKSCGLQVICNEVEKKIKEDFH